MHDTWRWIRAGTFVALALVTFGLLFTHIGALAYSGSGYCSDGSARFGYAQNDGAGVDESDRGRRILVQGADPDACVIPLNRPADGGVAGWFGDTTAITISGGQATAEGWQLPHPYVWHPPLNMATALGERTLEAMGLIANLLGLLVFVGLAARELSEG